MAVVDQPVVFDGGDVGRLWALMSAAVFNPLLVISEPVFCHLSGGFITLIDKVPVKDVHVVGSSAIAWEQSSQGKSRVTTTRLSVPSGISSWPNPPQVAVAGRE